MKLKETIAPVPVTEICGVVEQAAQKGWKAGIFDFNHGKQPGVDYFNCGVIERPDGRWLICRRSKWEKREDFGYNDLMAFLLDDVRLIRGQKIHMGQQFPHEHFEDPRAMYVDGRTFISCCNFVRHKNAAGREVMTYPHQIISEVRDDWTLVKRYDPVYGKNARDAGGNTGHEKNFCYWFDKVPKMIYWADPHTIVHFDWEFKVTSESKLEWNAGIWQYGQIRGGSPPILVDGLMWTFFHSSTPWSVEKRQYHLGAYAFEPHPPYKIRLITLNPLLSGSRYDRWYPSKPPAVFCCGSSTSYKIGKTCHQREWFLTYGVNDIDCAYLKLPHSDLKELMVCPE